MSWMINDFQCMDCSHTFEELWDPSESADSETPWIGQVSCPLCQSQSVTKELSTPGLGTFTMMDKQSRSESLKKRSLDHSKKLMRQDMDKHRAKIQGKVNALKG